MPTRSAWGSGTFLRSLLRWRLLCFSEGCGCVSEGASLARSGRWRSELMLGIQAYVFFGPPLTSDRAAASTALIAYAVFAAVIWGWMIVGPPLLPPDRRMEPTHQTSWSR